MDIDSPFDLLGLFQGVGLPFRAESAPLHMPNMIWLYRRPTERRSRSGSGQEPVHSITAAALASSDRAIKRSMLLSLNSWNPRTGQP